MPIAESRLEILQVCKLLQCVREKDKTQIEKMTTSGIPHLINYNDSTEGTTALSVAAIANDDDMLQFLLDLGAHPDVVDLKGRTAAMRAAEYGHVECLEKLTKARANMRIVDLEGKGVIFYCITPTQRHARCLELVVLHGAEVNNVSKDGVPVFVLACEASVENSDMCEVLLQKGADPNKASEKTGRTALMAAANSGGTKVTRLILEAGGDVNSVDSRRNHAAHFAAKGGHLEVLALMAGYSAEFNHNDSQNNCPVHIAALNGHGACCKFLSQRGCNPKNKNTEGQTPKALAKDNGHKDALKECKKAEKTFGKVSKNNEPWAIQLYDWAQSRQQGLEAMFKKYDPDDLGTVSKVDFEEVLNHFSVPLEDEEEMAKIATLHDKSKDGKIDYREFIGGKKYLHKNFLMSAFEGKKKKKKKGGKKGKKKGKFKLVMPICTQEEGPRTYGGNPPEMYIERHMHFTDTVRFDRDKPPTHPLQDDSAWYLQQPDRTFININEAAKLGDYDSLKNAFSRGLPADTRDKYYKTPLMVACADGRIEMVKFLLNNGAHINSRDNFKWTPLHHACHAGQLDVIDLLIRNGAEMDASSMSGGTPLTRAIESSKQDVVEYLINVGVKLQTENKKGLTPNDIAQAWADPRVLEIVTRKWDSLPQPKDKGKGKKGSGNRAKSGRPKSAPGEPKDGAVTQSLQVNRGGMEEFHHQRKGSILRAASALAGGLEEKEDITYMPLKAWTKQPTTNELIREREINRERFGWEVDFDDFEMPFKKNISKKIEMFGELEEE